MGGRYVARKGFLAGSLAVLVFWGCVGSAPSSVSPSATSSAASVQTLTPPATSAYGQVAAISSGNSYTCVLLASHNVECWGRNSDGELGNGTQTSSASPSLTRLADAKFVAAGAQHACALLTDGTVDCWGYNSSGQVDGDIALTRSPTPTPTAVRGIAGATAVSAGGEQTCALLSDRIVTCWGERWGRDTSAPFDPSPARVAGLSDVTAISVGGSHACALLSDSTVECWGSNHYGTLGDGTRSDSLTPVRVVGLSGVREIAAGLTFSCALLATGRVSCWGTDLTMPPAGAIPTWHLRAPSEVPDLTGVTAISAGQEHICALVSGGSVRCWGDGENGQLGVDEPRTRSGIIVSPITVPGLPPASAVAAGYFHTCALLVNGRVMCWGRNGFGQPGNAWVGEAVSGPVYVVGL